MFDCTFPEIEHRFKADKQTLIKEAGFTSFVLVCLVISMDALRLIQEIYTVI